MYNNWGKIILVNFCFQTAPFSKSNVRHFLTPGAPNVVCTHSPNPWHVRKFKRFILAVGHRSYIRSLPSSCKETEHGKDASRELLLYIHKGDDVSHNLKNLMDYLSTNKMLNNQGSINNWILKLLSCRLISGSLWYTVAFKRTK